MRILFVDIDTLRPDHMGCYGYFRNTTPNLDAVAADGIRFENYFCTDAPCLPSRAALFSGRFGIHNGIVGHAGTAAERWAGGLERGFKNPDDQNNLVNIFRKAGMYTASISTFPERHSAWWFNAGFHEMHNLGLSGRETAGMVTPVALDWLDRHGQEDNWFLHLHMWDPHTPYRAPEEFGNPFADSPISDWIDEETVRRHLDCTGPHSLLELSMYDDHQLPDFPRMPARARNLEELRRVFDGYDCGVRYADEQLGRIFDQMRELGIYEDCAILVSSDHGENFGELGIYCEHGTADRATCRIPMLLKWPGGPRGTADSRLRYHIDLVPTLAELLGTEAYPKWDGSSYAALLQGGEDAGRESLVISQMAHVCQRAAVFEDWIYLRTLHDGYRLFDREMLFHLSEDPHEQFDVKDRYPEVCARGAKIILDWQEEAMLRSGSTTDPMWTVMKENGPYHTWRELPDYLKHLEKTGRSKQAQLLRERHPDDL
ncbi:MAG: sulfatase [Provencibacterium sp.]|jgi:choline-sulfatase|nr:sulfatase [Provencibacterium sp.]